MCEITPYFARIEADINNVLFLTAQRLLTVVLRDVLRSEIGYEIRDRGEKFLFKGNAEGGRNFL